MEDGRLNILTRGTRPFRVVEEQDDLPYPAGDVEFLDDREEAPDASTVEAAHEAYAELVEQATDNAAPRPRSSAAMTAYEMAATVDFGLEAKQGLLDLRSENARLRLVTRLFRAARQAAGLRRARAGAGALEREGCASAERSRHEPLATCLTNNAPPTPPAALSRCPRSARCRPRGAPSRSGPSRGPAGVAGRAWRTSRGRAEAPGRRAASGSDRSRSRPPLQFTKPPSETRSVRRAPGIEPVRCTTNRSADGVPQPPAAPPRRARRPRASHHHQPRSRRLAQEARHGETPSRRPSSAAGSKPCVSIAAAHAHILSSSSSRASVRSSASDRLKRSGRPGASSGSASSAGSAPKLARPRAGSPSAAAETSSESPV